MHVHVAAAGIPERVEGVDYPHTLAAVKSAALYPVFDEHRNASGVAAAEWVRKVGCRGTPDKTLAELFGSRRRKILLDQKVQAGGNVQASEDVGELSVKSRIVV